VKYPEWEQQYRDAMLELNLKKLAQRIENAETAIVRRQRTLIGSVDDLAERIAIHDALSGLNALRRSVPTARP
jgi:hypothetical protein